MTKNRQGGTLPLRPDLAAELQAYLADKLPTAKAFRLPHDVSRMLQSDLADAGIPFRDQANRCFDFHAWRHQFGTLLANSGVHPRQAMELMRHHRIDLTMGLYTHTLRDAPSKAIASLPDLSPEILRFSCAVGGLGRTSTNADGPLAAPKPRFDADNGPISAISPP